MVEELGETEMTNEDQLSMWLEMRQNLVAEKAATENALKELDNEIKVFMIQHQVEEYTEEGMRMRVATGRNTTIIKKAVIDTLSIDLNFDPDQVEWFLQQVTQTTEYDFVDCRKVKA
jgi:hypothetical protein